MMNPAIRLQAALSVLALAGIAALFFQFAGATEVPVPLNLQSLIWNEIWHAVHDLDLARALGLSFFWLPIPISVRLFYLLVARRMPGAADSIAYVLGVIATIGTLFLWFSADSAFAVERSTAAIIPIGTLAVMARSAHSLRLLGLNGIFALQAAYITGAVCALESTFPIWDRGALLTLFTLVVYLLQVASMWRAVGPQHHAVSEKFSR